MHDVAPVVDERKALCADFIGSDDLTAAPGRAKQSQTDGGTEQGEKHSVLAFYAMQTCFELRESNCVHDPSITRITLPLAIYFCLHRGSLPENISGLSTAMRGAESSAKISVNLHGAAWKFQAATMYCEPSVSFMRWSPTCASCFLE